jgi:hypothetical protein
VQIARQGASQGKTVAVARHGGTLTDAVPITGSWLIYLEYRQHLQSSSADFWYLNAVDWTTGRLVELASATKGPALQELPWYDAADGKAAWDQLDSRGMATLRIHDFSTGKSTTLALPSDMYPVQPAIAGKSVVFVDNSTDPGRKYEDFSGRHGSLRRLDLTTGSVVTLSSDPTAWVPRVGGNEVVWTVASSSTSVVSAVQLAGGTVAILGGSNPITPQTNGSVVVWYDSATLHFMLFRLADKRTVQLQVGSWPDIRSVFSLCGSRLFFVLPTAVDAGVSTIRYVDLPLTST